MTHEHPFAQYVRILGKGPRLSRALTRVEARDAVRMLLAGQADPVQVGAFLCLLRVKTETAEEVAGWVDAVRETLALPEPLPAIDLDWSSYAGKARHLPWFILSALLLAENGVAVCMHGTEGHTAGRLYTRETLGMLGLPVASSLAEGAAHLRARSFAYLPLEVISPRLKELMELKALLGVRSPIHTITRMVNPLRARCSINSVFHPAYRAVHQEAAEMLGERHMAVFKGDGGEVERRPEKPCLVQTLHDHVVHQEEWPALLPEARAERAEDMDPERLRALWQGRLDDEVAAATVIGTASIALHLVGRAATLAEAEALARTLWQDRDRARLAGAA